MQLQCQKWKLGHVVKQALRKGEPDALGPDPALGLQQVKLSIS